MYLTKPLGEIIKITKGKKVNYSPEKGKYNYIDIGILRTRIIEQYTNDEGVFCDEKNILIAWDGSKSGTTGFGLEGVIGSTLAKLKLKDENISTEFVGKFLQSNFGYLNKNTSGAAIPHLRKDILENLQIPLPPLQTQQKIVEKLDKIFEKIDKNIEITKKNIANVEEENNSLLEEIFSECEKEFGLEKFSEILEICEYGSSEKSFDYLENGVPVLRMGNIQNGKIDFSDLKFCPKDSKALPKLFLKKYDLLFNRTNSWELVGKTGIFEGNDDEISFAGYLIRLRFFKNKVLQKFGNYFLNSQGFRKNQLEKQIDQTAGQANFSASKLKTCKIPLPPLSTQQKIVEKLDKIFSTNSELKNFYEKNLKNLEELKQSILKQAFEDENFIK